MTVRGLRQKVLFACYRYCSGIWEDGGLADIEIQKIGYAFPGERSACYSADLLLRQYKKGEGEDTGPESEIQL